MILLKSKLQTHINNNCEKNVYQHQKQYLLKMSNVFKRSKKIEKH